jgi:hypothetical protein
VHCESELGKAVRHVIESCEENDDSLTGIRGPMRLWEDTVLRVEHSPDHGTPPELPNLPKRISVDELLQPWLMMTVKRAWRKLRRPATA